MEENYVLNSYIKQEVIHLYKINKFFLILLFFLSACSSVPKYPSNACKIFGEKYLWYKHSKKYVLYEQYAKENKLGIWRGTFIEPEKWRRIMN